MPSRSRNRAIKPQTSPLDLDDGVLPFIQHILNLMRIHSTKYINISKKAWCVILCVFFLFCIGRKWTAGRAMCSDAGWYKLFFVILFLFIVTPNIQHVVYEWRRRISFLVPLLLLFELECSSVIVYRSNKSDSTRSSHLPSGVKITSQIVL